MEHATAQELNSAEISEELRMELNAEFLVNGEAQSITIYVGTFADAAKLSRTTRGSYSKSMDSTVSFLMTFLQCWGK